MMCPRSCDLLASLICEVLLRFMGAASVQLWGHAGVRASYRSSIVGQ